MQTRQNNFTRAITNSLGGGKVHYNYRAGLLVFINLDKSLMGTFGVHSLDTTLAHCTLF